MGSIRYVPDDYATIQAAVNACNDFDTIVIAPGRYIGPGNRNISFKGKTITVRSTDPTNSQIISETIIDCEGQGRGFVFYMGEKADSTLSGLTITNGYGLLGGAIYCYNNSSPSINNCVIKTNSAVFGGAIASTNSKSHPNITNCTITANSALVGGGGIYCNGGSPTIKNCIITGNSAPDGGAIYSHNAGNPLIANCTIAANTAAGSAAGIYCYKSSDLAINNSILWGNNAPLASEVRVSSLGAPTSIRISYCDIQNPEKNVICDSDCSISWGLGNINSDPYLVKMSYIDNSKIYVAGDYHLPEGSPCIDAGDPDYIAEPSETDIDGNPRILGQKIDIGADEFVSPLIVLVKVTPRTLNLRSSGEWISCSIILPEDYSIGDVQTDTVCLNEKIRPAWYRTDEAENKLLIKLDRFDTQQLLKDLEGLVPLTVTGKLVDGTKFAGSDTITVITKEK